MVFSSFSIVFMTALVITPIVRWFALNNGLIDNTDGDSLKIHKKPVAILGGVAIVAAMGVGIFVYRIPHIVYRKELLGIIFAALSVFGIGVVDDMKGAKPQIRFLVQVMAGIIVLLVGIKVNFIPIPIIAVPLTLFYIVGATNAFNMIDGMDGLCAGISLIACGGFFFIGVKQQNAFLMGSSLTLFAGLLGFFFYNFYPAKIFLGDAGSGFLGFIFGIMAIVTASNSYNFNNFISSILIIGIPVFDTAFAILRRFVRKKPIFTGDRGHIYDLLLKKGLSQPKVWFIICGMQLVLTAIGVSIYGYN